VTYVTPGLLFSGHAHFCTHNTWRRNGHKTVVCSPLSSSRSSLSLGDRVEASLLLFVLTVARGTRVDKTRQSLRSSKGSRKPLQYYNCIGQYTRVIRTVLTFQVHKELVSATDVYVLALCSLQQQVIRRNYDKLKLLAYRVHRESDNRFKCDYNHRGLSFNSKFIGNKATIAIKIISILKSHLHSIFQLWTV
jgi:hypothetical protein